MESCCHAKKPFVSAFILILSVFFVFLTIWVLVGTLNKIKEGKTIGREIRDSISVSGTGEVYAKPDLAMIDISVITEKKTVDEAVSENATKMNAVISAVKGLGVEEKDIKTTTFSVNPRYEYLKEGATAVIEPAIYSSVSRRTLVGYEVSQKIEVKIRDLSKVGAITEAATSAGANDTGNLYFTIENRDQFENAAKEEAIKKAKEKADSLSAQLGVKLGRIINFYENSYYPVEKSMDAAGLGGASSIAPAVPDIQTGENKITANVTIVYEIE